MTSLAFSRDPAVPGIASQRLIGAVYVAALFLSAALLFGIQPMFAKMVLPKLGGSASVWSVAMVFFQAMLLAGYLYAHLLARRLSFGVAVFVHLAVLAATFFALPIAIAQDFGRPPADGEAFWLIGLFAASVGLPFFAVAGNAPLLQAWFVRSGHKDAANPYFLYGASNVGSFASLIAYPLLVEPNLTLHEQSRLWTIGFAVLAALIALCASLVVVARQQLTLAPAPIAAAPLSLRARAEWTFLAFVPSALLVAVTAQIATDVASAPFLWVIPLALYLLTFVLVFRQRPLIPEAAPLFAQAALIAAIAILLVVSRWVPVEVALALHLTTFFVAALVCHSVLYRRRPEATRLTEFYLFMSFGGALGGAFAALAAPHLFKTVAEYPILLALTLIARPGVLEARFIEWRRQAAPILAAGGLLIAPALLLGSGLSGQAVVAFMLTLLVIAGLMQWQSRHGVRLVALGFVLFALSRVYEPGFTHATYARSFFGVHKVVDFADGRVRLLFHGTTIHGAERLLENDGAPVSGPPEKLTYYYDGGPFEEAIDAIRARAGGKLSRVALVGLGVGALACSRKEGEDWTVYEIDPELVRLSTQSGLFRTMPTCGRDLKIVIGDARLTLADEKAPFDLIILDAYSSDNVPVHLLTREAMALYRSLLSQNGAIVMNITNRNIGLTDIVAASAEAAGLKALEKRDPKAPDFNKTFHARAEIAVLAKSETDFGALSAATGWTAPSPAPGFRTWTDDYSDIVGAIWRKWRQGS